MWPQLSPRLVGLPPSVTATRLVPQEYNVTKRVEHRWKSLVHDGSTISAVSPQTYSRRFQAFMKKVFV